jgi:hypothetical protein
MPKKVLAVAGLGALAAAAAFAPAAVSGDSDQALRADRVIHVTETIVQFGDIAVPPAHELNVGDAFAFSADLFRSGEKIGDDGATCVVVRVDGPVGVHHCIATYRLPDGQLTVQGLITFDTTQGTADAPFTVAVTGGTGAYRRAHGTLHDEPGDTTSELTFRLIH